MEAEGSGTTKTEALRAAWIEAVRNAAGMFMTGSTRIRDDDIEEAVSAFSRGHVESYEILSESSEGGVWTVRIRADIDNDEMKPLVKGSGSRTIDLTKSPEAAAAFSSLDARRNGAAMLISALNDLDWASCLDYSLSIKNIDNRLWIVH